jgi:hypothetical protein
MDRWIWQSDHAAERNIPAMVWWTKNMSRHEDGTGGIRCDLCNIIPFGKV